MSSKRLLWADNLKGFLILLVVLGHVLQYFYPGYVNLHLYNYIYSFHMPSFMAISGYLSYRKGQEARSLSRIKIRGIQLLIPYLVWTSLFCLIIGKTVWMSMIVTPVYWFLLLLFFISTLMTFGQNISYKLGCNSLITAIVIIIVCFILKICVGVKWFSLDILYVHLIFYSFGWYLRKYKNHILKDWFIIPSGFFLFFSGWFYRPCISPPFLSFFPPVVYFIVTGVSATVFLISLFCKYFDFRTFFIGNLGKMTLGVYVIHLLICVSISPFMKICNEMVGCVVGIIVSFLLITLVSVGLTYLIQRQKHLRRIVGL